MFVILAERMTALKRLTSSDRRNHGDRLTPAHDRLSRSSMPVHYVHRIDGASEPLMCRRPSTEVERLDLPDSVLEARTNLCPVDERRKSCINH